MASVGSYSLIIDLNSCQTAIIKSREKIQDYVINLCKMMNIERQADCQITAISSASREGYIMIQLLDGAMIVAHFYHDSEAAFIDIFSATPINEDMVTDFTLSFFGAVSMEFSLIPRGR